MNSPSTISSNIASEYVRYFSRQLITADDMRAEQEYFREKLRRHNRMLHGWGVVCGAEVTPEANWQIKVGKGYAITPTGDEICIPEDVIIDLANDSPKAYDPCSQPTPCSPVSEAGRGTEKTIYLAVCYSECNTRPVRIHPAGCGCGCNDASCEYSRVRESYEFVCLDELPEFYKAQKSETELRGFLADALANNKASILPCPPIINSDYVVLAEIALPKEKNIPVEGITDKRHPCFNIDTLRLLGQAF